MLSPATRIRNNEAGEHDLLLSDMHVLAHALPNSSAGSTSIYIFSCIRSVWAVLLSVRSAASWAPPTIRVEYWFLGNLVHCGIKSKTSLLEIIGLIRAGNEKDAMPDCNIINLLVSIIQDKSVNKLQMNTLSPEINKTFSLLKTVDTSSVIWKVKSLNQPTLSNV